VFLVLNYDLYGMIVFDIETTLIGKTQTATALGFTTKNLVTIYHNDLVCVESFIKAIYRRRYNKNNCIAHNFANFDSFFIVPVFLKIKKKFDVDIKMYIRNNNIIFLKVVFRGFTLFFRDSFLYVGKPLKYIYTLFS